jgi:hypothetical protein|tara:strand:+ start:806 stop:1408 length:603 start_codon:yes stop_codon:yes gene_type:complete
MIERKKKLRIIQISLLVIGVLIILFTYSSKNRSAEEEIIPKKTLERVKKQQKSTQDGDVFFNIEYAGLDLNGNRYILKSEEAYTNKSNQELVNMKLVHAVFYFKDKTILNIWSKEGIYNNKTLDMIFEKNVRGVYEGSKLFSEKAVYSNSESFLTITENVKVEDIRGTMFADKLLFDIKKKELKIESFNDNKINANVSLK